ncbi:Flagellar motor switch protein FliG [Gemmata sp. SH-PL17]|uniref:FliG C-terminal domain-containing protein n=1 Tax=Gemmata sp. SH-PL17 TaxID=1630693 RepID=UPI00078D544A|nr:FliG C-terminal domain-containing protein [Gemmata sp. SH-PL17]AMV25638.1 Flagellar motor switch protein FliG [Gemmata sp. SH-PL17]
MANAPGEDVAVLLLRALPADVAENVLGQMGADDGERLRIKLRTAPVEPPPANDLDAAVAQFFDIQRIAQRITAASAPPAPTEPAEPEPPVSPIEELKTVSAEQLARALDGESSGAIAMLLSSLDAKTTGNVIRRLPPDIRPDIALRLTKPGPRNLALLQPLAKAVLEKVYKLKDVPPEPSQEELIQNLADMLRTFPRTDRTPVVLKLEETDPELATRVIEKLYRIEDIMRIPDRQVQMLLGKLDVKTVAVALKGAAPAIRQKVTSNMSSRSKSVLEEESELLGSIADSVVREAQTTVLAAIRKGEEDGQITMD